MKKLKRSNKFIATVMVGCILVGNVSNAATLYPYSRVTAEAQQELDKKCSMKPVHSYFNYGKRKLFKVSVNDLKLAKQYVKKIKSLTKGKKVVIEGRISKVAKLSCIIDTDYTKDGLQGSQLVDSTGYSKRTYRYAQRAELLEEQKFMRKYNKKLDRIISSLGINENTTQYDAIVKIYAYMSENYSYNLVMGGYTEDTAATAKALEGHSCRDVVYTKNGICSCFAKLLQDLLKRCGIQCGYVSDTTAHHAFNAVKFGGKIYYLDPTWDMGLITQDYITEEMRPEWYFFFDQSAFNKMGRKAECIAW